MRRGPLCCLALLPALAGCGAQHSNGFGAATQKPPVATAATSTALVAPGSRQHTYPRQLARRVQQACLHSGAGERICGRALMRLEETVPAQRVAAGVASHVRLARASCRNKQ